MKVSSPIGTKRGSTSFGTFTRANVSSSDDGVAQRTRRARATGSRCTGTAARADCQRGEDGEDLLAEQAVGRLELTAGAVRACPPPGCPFSASAGRTCSSHARDVPVAELAVRSTIRSIVSDADRPSASRPSIPASTWSCRPATRTMKNSSRLTRRSRRTSRARAAACARPRRARSTRSLKSSQDSSRFDVQLGESSSGASRVAVTASMPCLFVAHRAVAVAPWGCRGRIARRGAAAHREG